MVWCGVAVGLVESPLNSGLVRIKPQIDWVELSLLISAAPPDAKGLSALIGSLKPAKRLRERDTPSYAHPYALTHTHTHVDKHSKAA